MSEDCKVVKLMMLTSSEPVVGNITLQSAVLCCDCCLCSLLDLKCSQHNAVDFGMNSAGEGITVESKEFWRRLDRITNNLFWNILKTDCEHMYTITRMLNKAAIIKHYLTKNFSKKPNLVDLSLTNNYYFFGPPSQILNAIQVEELRLSEDLACAISHYSKGAKESDILHRLEILDISENIIKSLQILCKKVMEERCG